MSLSEKDIIRRKRLREARPLDYVLMYVFASVVGAALPWLVLLRAGGRWVTFGGLNSLNAQGDGPDTVFLTMSAAGAIFACITLTVWLIQDRKAAKRAAHEAAIREQIRVARRESMSRQFGPRD